jgi:hypothetical protein
VSVAARELQIAINASVFFFMNLFFEGLIEVDVLFGIFETIQTGLPMRIGFSVKWKQGIEST